LYSDGTNASGLHPDIKIAFLDVGQGDTAVISCPETREAIVVDCINAKAVKDYLVEEHITHLSGIIVTHLHADHYSGVPVRVLCTQATNQCRQSVLNQDATVTNLLKAQAHKSGRKLIGSNRGCPCAGTVIIELKDKAHILQPDIQFHQESIIKPHFTEHKCNLDICDVNGRIMERGFTQI
jgi:ribonuclease BN (tRNA processing enzyme)